jgi:steroid delta-isomerase-like uncharacterized protein
MQAHIDAWNAHDLDGLMALFSEDCTFEASGGPQVEGERFVGREAVRSAFAAVLEGMPDAHWGEGRHHPIEDGYGVSEWILRGTRRDGRRLEVSGCDFLTIKGGRIAKKSSFRKQRPLLEPGA